MASHGQAMPASRPGQHRPQVPPSQYQIQQQQQQQQQYQQQQQVPVLPQSSAPQGTFAPGTKIQVGSHRVVIQKYLSEGGFAHVYLVKMPTPIDGTDLAVLKRVAVPDKDALRSMRTEVETMKRLKGHRAIVTYFDSHASELRGGGYEVFLLMEYCDGGGLMDFMNTRLQHRLTEPEILSIFSDVAEGVACMHYLKPPLLHRDLKVENVLISKGGSGKSGGSSMRRRFKLCDFGSAAPPKAAPVSVVECRLMDEDVQKHTTLQYRSPEMIDVYRRQPIDEKSDIWALGVLLYKLCYYTTPFEDQSSQLAILNASYRFPSHPVFSERLKALIASMLKENQDARPNIYQVLKEACVMQGIDTPVKDIYSGRSQSEPRGSNTAPAGDKPAAVVGAVFAPTAKPQQAIPDIVPMRRGRPAAAPSAQVAPAAPSTQQKPAPKPSPSPMRVTKGDPFAALDAKAVTGSADELSGRFPTLDQFSILHDQGARFSFEDSQAAAGGASVPASPEAQKSNYLNQRVAERLADDAFVSPPQTKATPQAAAAAATAAVAAGKVSPTTGISKSVSEPLRPTNRLPGRLDASPERLSKPAAPVPQRASEMSRASAIISSTPELQAISAQREQKPKMVSTGTMTSPSPTPPPPSSSADLPNRASQYQVFRFPPADQTNRSSSLPRKQYQDSTSGGPAEYGHTPSPQLRTQAQAAHIRHPSSSRPSLEGQRPNLDSLEPVTASVPSLPSRPRPTSTYLESNMDYLREREVSGGSASGNAGNSAGGSSGRPMLSPGQPSPPKYGNSDFRAPSVSPRPDLNNNSNSNSWGDEAPIESNVDYLRSMEEQPDNKRDRGVKPSSGKRSSMTALTGTKNILAGKFGDAFKRFETSTGGSKDNSAVPPGPSRTPSPLKQLERTNSSYGDGGSNERYHDDPYQDDLPLEVTDDMPPEMRREIERRRLSMEEKRVAAAAAEYRQRIGWTDTGASSVSRTTTSSSGAPPPMPLPKNIPKSIGGVSRAVSIQNRVQNLLSEAQSTTPVTRTASGYGHFTDDGSAAPAGGASDTSARSTSAPNNARGSFDERPEVRRKPVLVGRASMPVSERGGGAPPPKPSAKPKPMHLNKPLPMIGKQNEGGRPGSPVSSYPPSRPINSSRGPPPPSKSGASSSQTALMASDLPGQPVLEGMSVQDRDDYIRDFTRRFPSLTTIEMVERDFSAEDAHRR